MKYNMQDASIVKLIKEKLKEIEEKENVRILHAVESGSRAWGVASPDSDYDVRFIYVRPLEHYLKLENKKDFIDWELNEVLDINGWDLSKALQHFHKSNATLFEWANSPVVYYTTKEWEQIKDEVAPYFSCKTSIYHYYGTAKKNYTEYLNDDMVKYKKYFYVLRPLLACKWIAERACVPPVSFHDLAGAMLENNMQEVVEELLKKKVQMNEAEKAQPIVELNEYIAKRLEYYQEKAASMKDDRKAEWADLDELFIKVVREFKR